jgi:hypothetical protein
LRRKVGGLIRQALSGISVAEVMTPDPVQAPDNAIICPLDRVPTVSPLDPATHLLNVSDVGCSEGRTLVVDNGRLVGIISPSDINRLLQMSSLGRAQAPVSSGA